MNNPVAFDTSKPITMGKGVFTQPDGTVKASIGSVNFRQHFPTFADANDFADTMEALKARVDEAVDDNDEYGAITEVAKFLGMLGAVRTLALLEAKHIKAGELTQDIKELRDEVKRYTRISAERFDPALVEFLTPSLFSGKH